MRGSARIGVAIVAIVLPVVVGCSGTNPSEGEEIVELVIALLNELAPQAWVSTHFLQFAARLQEQRPVDSLRFLQVAMDSHQQPCYTFVPGVATTSLAVSPRVASLFGSSQMRIA